MIINLPLDTYKGVDGSSLSDTRCQQIVQVYEMLENLGTKFISYKFIQEEAERCQLFGQTNAKSAIRTFFPLLKKLHFVYYEKSTTIIAQNCFSDLGKQFVLACRALQNISNATPNRGQIIASLENVKSNCIKKGLVSMNNDPDYNNHNIWVALKLFKELNNVHWNYFLYTLYKKDIGCNESDIIMDIREHADDICKIEFLKDDNEPLPNTCYGYIRSLLEEAGIIVLDTNNHYCLTVDGVSFINNINV